MDNLLKIFYAICDRVHMFTGAFIVETLVMFHHPSLLWYVIPAFAGLTAWKEFYWDQHFETTEIRGSNFRDFIFYQIGWAGGLILYFASTFVK